MTTRRKEKTREIKVWIALNYGTPIFPSLCTTRTICEAWIDDRGVVARDAFKAVLPPKGKAGK